MVLNTDNFVFVLDKLLKTSKHGRPLNHREFLIFLHTRP